MLASFVGFLYGVFIGLYLFRSLSVSLNTRQLDIEYDHLFLNMKATELHPRLVDVQKAQLTPAYPQGTPPVPGLLVVLRTVLYTHLRN